MQLTAFFLPIFLKVTFDALCLLNPLAQGKIPNRGFQQFCWYPEL